MDKAINIKIEKKLSFEKIYFNIPEKKSNMQIKLKKTKDFFIQFLLYDEKGNLRGQFLSINNEMDDNGKVLSINSNETSPYFYPEEINDGVWRIDLGVIYNKKILEEPKYIEIEINYNIQNLPLINENFKFKENLKTFSKSNKENGWYKGDFHTHTIFSDGKMSREENNEMAKKRDVDFYVATDHNIYPTSWPQSDVFVIPGIEATYRHGHFNLLFGENSVFNNYSFDSMFTEENVIDLIKNAKFNGLISINHPRLKKWVWEYKETPLEYIDCIEIINNPTYKDAPNGEEEALILWDNLLKDGHKITGIGGSDSHLKPNELDEGANEPSLISDPYNYLYCADKMHFESLKNALKNNNVIVSRNEFIDFKINDSIAGNNLNDIQLGKANIKIIDAKNNYIIEWIVDGEIVKNEIGKNSYYEFDFKDNAYHWIRANIREENNRLYGFTNPIFFNEKVPTYKKIGEVYESIGWTNEKINPF